ncbi:MAG: serine/threonine-protein kinase [Planctomycetota bacterium]
MAHQSTHGGTPDERAEEVLAACLARPPGERRAAFEAAVRDRPELAQGLRARALVLEQLGIAALGGGGAGAEDTVGVPEQLGEYRLLERLGGGGMGVVYRAVQTTLGRDVALKLIRPGQLFSPGTRRRFRREAEALARLRHPGIVSVYGVGEEDGIPFYAMELVEGGSLERALGRLRGRAPESLTARDLAPAHGGPDRGRSDQGTWVDACVRLALQLARALDHAHGRGVIHRDVKPSNVVLSREGGARLVDFGLTLLAEEEGHTRAGAALGTLPYMPPEQLQDAADVDERADVYALGATLYELLTLRAPFAGEGRVERPDDGPSNELALRGRILAGALPSLRARNPRVPRDVETVCVTAMAPERGRRYPTAAALADDLQRLVERRPIAARPPGPLLRLLRWKQRSPAAATAALLSALVAVGVPTALWIQSERTAGAIQRSLTAETQAKELAQRRLEAIEAHTASAIARADFVAELLQAVFAAQNSGGKLPAPELLRLGEERVAAQYAADPRLRGDLRMLLVAGWIDLRDPARALEVLDRAEADYVEAHGGAPAAPPSDVALDRARVLNLLGRHAEAEAEVDGVIARYGDLDAVPARYRGSAQLQKARAARGLGRLEEAGERLRRLLEGAPPADTAVAVRDAVQLAVARLELAHVLGDLGRWGDAEGHADRAIADLGSVLPAPHPELVAALGSLGVFVKRQGRLAEAEAHYRRALAMASALWSEDNLVTATITHNLALLAEARGDGEAHLAGLRRAAELCGRVRGTGDFDTLCARAELAAALADAGERAEAEELYAELLDPLRAAPRVEPVVLARALLWLGRFARDRGERAAAIAHVREALLVVAECEECADCEGWEEGLEAELARLERR